MSMLDVICKMLSLACWGPHMQCKQVQSCCRPHQVAVTLAGSCSTSARRNASQTHLHLFVDTAPIGSTHIEVTSKLNGGRSVPL